MFYGWWIVIASILIGMYTGGITHYGFTAIIEPISNQFGWSYTAISFAASLRGVEMGLIAPLMGLMVDRLGPRKLMFAGAIASGLSLMLLSRTTSLGMFYVAYVLIAMAASTSSYTVTMTAVVNWFREKVGIAIGVLASGMACGGLLVPGLVRLIDIYGWQAAMFLCGLGMWVIALPLSLLVRQNPEQYGHQPDGGVSKTAVVSQSLISPQNSTIDIQTKRALSTRAFWHIALALTCYSLVINAVVTHVMPYLGSIGIARSISSLVAGAIPLASIFGRLGFGWLGDRLDKRWVLAAGFTLEGLGLLFFGYTATGGMWLLVPFLILFCTGWGGNIPVRAALVREYFGRKRFGTIYGLTIGIAMLGNIVGPPLAGWVFDTWHSYQGAWFSLAVLTIVAAFIIATTPQVSNTIQPAE